MGHGGKWKPPDEIISSEYLTLEGKVPQGELLPEIEAQIIRLFSHVGNLIEKGHLKQALDDVFVFVRYCNKYFDGEKPWETRQTDLPHCANTLFNCVQMIANLAILLQPFVPFFFEASARVAGT